MDPTGSTDPRDAADAPALEEPGADAPADDGEEPFAPEGFERWRRRSAVGSVGTGIARGLQSVFAPPPNQPVVVASVPGDPPDPDRLQVILDPDDPSKSVVVLPPADGTGNSAGSDDAPA